jgi:DeoR/GlpR family transcriptional regulator of sugar metabolism
VQRSFRHKAIIRAVSGGEVVSVEALSALTGASTITVRRDLAELSEHGLVRRTRGGATRPESRGAPMPFSVRFDTDQERKDALGALAAGLVADDESVILDSGTTCYAVARHLVGRPVTTLALSMHAAAVLASHPAGTVVVPGGLVETDTLAFTGSSAVDAVRETRADVFVLGACAALPQQGLTSTTYEDAQVKRAALAAATRRVLVASADKLARSTTFRFGDFADVTHLVTTPDAPAPLLAVFRAEGIDVRTIAEPVP